MSIRIEVPAGGPLFDGHFPGRPILPGVAELAMVVRALSPAGGPDAVRAIPFMRFRGIVLPGDVLELTARASLGGAVRFDLRRRGTVVANGAMVFGVPDPAERAGSTAAAQMPTGSPALDELLPHRPPMRFVETLLEASEDRLTCITRVPPACALVSRGAAPAWVALEAGAQAAALWEALRRWPAAAKPRIGYLVSLRDVDLYRETIPAAIDLVTSIRLLAHAAPLSTYTVEVAMEDAVVLRGTIGTYLSD